MLHSLIGTGTIIESDFREKGLPTLFKKLEPVPLSLGIKHVLATKSQSQEEIRKE